MNIQSFNTDPQFYGYMFLSIGITIRFIIWRRRFNRRNVAGLYRYANFEVMIVIRLFEFLFKWIATGLILLGAFMAVKW